MRTLKILAIALLGFGTISLTACNKDEVAEIMVNAGGDDGDVTGTGGSTSESHTWNNTQSRAELNMDITSGVEGSMNITVTDANGDEVLNETIDKDSPDDSVTKCSAQGVAGDWTVTITLTDFNGDGSFTLSKGC